MLGVTRFGAEPGGDWDAEQRNVRRVCTGRSGRGSFAAQSTSQDLHLVRDSLCLTGLPVLLSVLQRQDGSTLPLCPRRLAWHAIADGKPESSVHRALVGGTRSVLALCTLLCKLDTYLISLL